MTKLLFILIFYIVGGWINPLQAQFVNLRMEIESELSADVIQNLNFGQVQANSGTNRINLGSPQMGIFQIRGLNNQQVLVSMDSPEELTNSSDESDESIGLSLEYAYTNTNENNVEEAEAFSGNTALFYLGNNGLQQNQFQSAFIYVFGNVEIGDVDEGNYEGTLMLTVEYQ